MRVLAYMPSFNDGDVIGWAIRHLLRQGASVHVLDGWSADGSAEIAAAEGATVEPFPTGGPSTEQNCTAILQRIEELAAESDTDWIIYSDADEIRRSIKPGETLRDGLARLQSFGCTAVDHAPYMFWPVDDGWHAGIDPEQYLRYFQDSGDIYCNVPQQKTWRNLGRVNLTNSGGHVVEFKGKVLPPERWIVKHYCYRSNAQAREKIRTRLERRCHKEHSAGWGVHYDHLTPESDFVRDPNKLKFWRDVEYPRP